MSASTIAMIALVSAASSMVLPLLEIHDLTLKHKNSIPSIGSCLNAAIMWLNYIAWACYACLMPSGQDGYFMEVSNMFCSVVCLYVMWVNYVHLRSSLKPTAWLTNVIFLLFGVVMLLCAYKGSRSTLDINIEMNQSIGFLAMSISVAYNLCPLILIPVVVRYGSDEISFPLCIAYNMSSALWCVYGILIHDSFVTYTNFFGGCVQFINLCLIIIIPKEREVSSDRGRGKLGGEGNDDNDDDDDESSSLLDYANNDFDDDFSSVDYLESGLKEV